MTGQKRGAAKPTQNGAKRRNVADGERIIEFLPPLKPHPKLMVTLGLLLALWLIALIIMRQTTVRPNPSAGTVPSLTP